MIKFKCNKLARDKTLENMKQDGIITSHKILNKNDLLYHLKQKLVEESKEVEEASSQNEIIAELADVFELLDAIIKVSEISLENIICVKEFKQKTRGGFDMGIYLETIEMDEDNKWVKHFRASPDKYKEN